MAYCDGIFQGCSLSSIRYVTILACIADASSGEDEKYKNASSKVDENCKKFWLSLKMRSLLTSPAKTWSGTVKIQSLTRGITFPGSNTSQIMIRECFPQLEKAISRHFQKEETHPTTSQGNAFLLGLFAKLVSAMTMKILTFLKEEHLDSRYQLVDAHSFHSEQIL